MNTQNATDTLKQALFILNETNDIGQSTCAKLGDQNIQISNMRSELKKMDETLTMSQKIMKRINRFCF
jgi:hypothetical protein